MKKSAVILQKTKNEYYLLTSDGEFKRKNLSGTYEIGQKIEMRDSTSRQRWIKPLSMAAAILLLLIMPFDFWGSLWVQHAIAAYYTVDINPSLELGVDKNNNVIYHKAINEDGRALINAINIKGDPIDQALEEILMQAAKQNYFIENEKRNVIIAEVPIRKSTNILDMDKMTQSLVLSMEDNSISVEIYGFKVDKEIYSTAEKLDISAGKLAVIVEASKKGQMIHKDEMVNEGLEKSLEKHGMEAKEILKQTKEDDQLNNYFKKAKSDIQKYNQKLMKEDEKTQNKGSKSKKHEKKSPSKEEQNSKAKKNGVKGTQNQNDKVNHPQNTKKDEGHK